MASSLHNTIKTGSCSGLTTLYRLDHLQQPVINIMEMYNWNSQGNVQPNQSQRLKRRAWLNVCMDCWIKIFCLWEQIVIDINALFVFSSVTAGMQWPCSRWAFYQSCYLSFLILLWPFRKLSSFLVSSHPSFKLTSLLWTYAGTVWEYTSDSTVFK